MRYTGNSAGETPHPLTETHVSRISPRVRGMLLRYGLTMLIVVLMTSTVSLLRLTIEGHIATIQLIYLLGVMLIAILVDTGPAFLAALLSFLYASYFFAEPHYSFHINNPEEAIRLVAFLAIALLGGGLAARARTHAARAEQLALEAAQARALAESDRLKSAILSSVSHDLRTPLTTIRGAIDELTATDIEWSPAHRQQLLTTIAEQSQRLHTLVSNLLDLSRIRAGAVHPHKDWYALDEVILHTINAQQALFNRHPLSLDLPAELPLIQLDFVLTEQVLVNLLHNAVTHTPPGTALLIQAWLDNDWIVVGVADRGPGIPPPNRSRIFEPFYRLGSVNDTQGSGVGLSVCQGFIQAQGGQIWVEEHAGGGARFCFRLPRHPQPKETG